VTWDCRRVWCAAKLRTCLLASPSLGIPCYRCQEVVGRLEDHCHWGSTDGVTFPFCDLKDKVETNFRSSFYAFTCFEFSFPCSGRTFVLKAQSQSGFFRFDIFLLPCNNTSSRRIPHSVHVWSLWYRLSWRLLYRYAGFWWFATHIIDFLIKLHLDWLLAFSSGKFLFYPMKRKLPFVHK